MQIDEIMEIIHDAELEDKYEMVSIKELDLNKQLKLRT